MDILQVTLADRSENTRGRLANTFPPVRRGIFLFCGFLHIFFSIFLFLTLYIVYTMCDNIIEIRGRDPRELEGEQNDEG